MHVYYIASVCPTLCDSMDCSLPRYSVHGILQTRILKWVAMPSSKGPSQPKDQTHVLLSLLHWLAGSLPLEPLGKPDIYTLLCIRWASPGALVVKNSQANAGDLKDTSLIPELERSLGEGPGNPLQYSFLENPMDRGAW